MDILLNTLLLTTIIMWIHSTARIDHIHISKLEFITDHTPRFYDRMYTTLIVTLLDPIIGLSVGLLFWGLFDFILNYLNGKSIYYIGTVSKTDIFFSKYKRLWVASKYISITTSIILIYLHGF